MEKAHIGKRRAGRRAAAESSRIAMTALEKASLSGWRRSWGGEERRRRSRLEGEHLLPGEDVVARQVLLLTPEVPVRRRRLVALVAAALELEVLPNHTRAEVKRRRQAREDLRVGDLAR